jgi:hypothetical protein
MLQFYCDNATERQKFGAAGRTGATDINPATSPAV